MIYLYGGYYSRNSYGVKCTYDIILTINNLGYQARLLCCHKKNKKEPLPDKYKKIFVSYNDMKKVKIEPSDIVIYPETIDDNPLNAKNVVRWILNRVYYLNGKGIQYNSTDLLYSYSLQIREDLPQLSFLLDERDFFKEIRSKYALKDQDTVSIYFGKVHPNILEEKKILLDNLLKKYRNINVITRGYPNNRADALKKIASSDLLISFDGLTTTNLESLLVGTPALILDDPFEIKNKSFFIDTKYAFNINDIEEAKIFVQNDLTFKSYCDWLDEQNNKIKKIIDDIILEFHKLEQDKNYKIYNEKKNKIISKIDKKLFDDYCKSEPFKHITFYEDIPPNIAKILCNHDENLKQYFSAVYRIQNSLINKIKNILNNSKTLKDFIKLPFKVINITIKYLQVKKLEKKVGIKKAGLMNLYDYKEALKYMKNKI